MEIMADILSYFNTILTGKAIIDESKSEDGLMGTIEYTNKTK